jgi:hypothetical protein
MAITEWLQTIEACAMRAERSLAALASTEKYHTHDRLTLAVGVPD